MAERDEMFDGVVNAFKAVSADITDIRVFADIVIKKRGRDGSVFKLCKPGIL